VKFPSAGILMISFVITANLQARCDPGNQMKSSAPALFPGDRRASRSKPDQAKTPSIPISIASNSQLQEASKQVRLHGMAE
jgi:hypothetical protein